MLRSYVINSGQDLHRYENSGRRDAAVTASTAHLRPSLCPANTAKWPNQPPPSVPSAANKWTLLLTLPPPPSLLPLLPPPLPTPPLSPPPHCQSRHHYCRSAAIAATSGLWRSVAATVITAVDIVSRQRCFHFCLSPFPFLPSTPPPCDLSRFVMNSCKIQAEIKTEFWAALRYSCFQNFGPRYMAKAKFRGGSGFC